MRKKKQKREIKKWAESLILRIGEAHCYFERKLFSKAGEPLETPDTSDIIKHRYLLRDIQLFVEKDF